MCRSVPQIPVALTSDQHIPRPDRRAPESRSAPAPARACYLTRAFTRLPSHMRERSECHAARAAEGAPALGERLRGARRRSGPPETGRRHARAKRGPCGASIGGRAAEE